MKKITYSVGVLTMSALVSYSFPAYSMGGYPGAAAAPAREGLHLDAGVQGNVEFTSVKYDDSSLDVDKTQLFSNSMPIKSHKTSVTPSIFAGMRYYLPSNMFWGFHIGDTPINKEVFDHDYSSGELSDLSSEYRINAKLTRMNSLYGKLSFGYFVLPNTDVNINGFLSWDIYKLKYSRDRYDTSSDPWKHMTNQTNHACFNWWGYGFGIAADHYFSSHFIASLGYNFVMHKSKNETLDSFSGSAGSINMKYVPAPIKLSNMHEHIVSLALMYEM